MLTTDILVAGTGIAGLSFAIKTAKKRPDLSITIMTKEEASTSNTQFAQGGIAAVIDTINDSFEQHIQDTLKAGGAHSDEKIVRMVVTQAPERLAELIAIGVNFDKIHSDNYDLALEGGHSQHRILHHKDTTGMEIERALLEEIKTYRNVSLLEKHSLIDLVIENEQCVGAFYFSPDNKAAYISCKTIVLCTGGCGQVFKHTTNPSVATGDGVAIAHRAGAAIKDMQYIQFHPTALYEPGKNPCFLLSEALRGFGAYVINEEGNRFLFQYDIRGELATRDIVSAAIGKELLKSGKDYVFLDCAHLNQKDFENHFPSILDYCRSIGINPFTDVIPITPVAHYQCGGIAVNQFGQSTINRLYALGECSHTGLHGKNRLASNSLLEATVFAHQAAENICALIDTLSFSQRIYDSPFTITEAISATEINSLKNKLQEIMQSVFIEENAKLPLVLKDLEQFDRLKDFYDRKYISKELIELLNLACVAKLIVESKISNQLLNQNIY